MSNSAKIEADTQRATTLMRGLAEACYNESDKRSDDDETSEEGFRFETIGVVTIVAWSDPEGNSREDVAYAFETKRHYVKTGILQDTLSAHLHRTSNLEEI